MSNFEEKYKDIDWEKIPTRAERDDLAWDVYSACLEKFMQDALTALMVPKEYFDDAKMNSFEWLEKQFCQGKKK